MTVGVDDPDGHDADEVLVAFCHALRAGGLDVTLDRTQAYLGAVAAVGAGDRSRVYWAGRATLCSDPDDTRVYDRAFESWFAAEHPRSRPSRPAPRVIQQADLGDGGSEGESEGDDRTVAMVASDEDALRHRDVATLSTVERKRIARMFARLEVHPPTRRSPRRGPHRRGDVDPQRTLRDQLRRGGEPGPIKHRRRRRRPRRVVLLVDVSGSMEPYADSLLRLAHRMVTAAPRSTEVFTLGTRLTRVTSALRLRDPDRALAAAGEVVPDWSGGTRLGEVLAAFVDRWGQRGMARGAVVVIASDGWERGDPAMLGLQVQRLQRLGHRVVWSNPHRGKVGYAPVQGGIAAALPYVDAFVAGHSMAAFAAIAEVVSRD